MSKKNKFKIGDVVITTYMAGGCYFSKKGITLTIISDKDKSGNHYCKLHKDSNVTDGSTIKGHVDPDRLRLIESTKDSLYAIY